MKKLLASANIKLYLSTVSAAALAVLSITSAQATQNYFQGFESGTGDWVADSGINQATSGAAPGPHSGSYFGELHNTDDGSGYPGFGDGGYSFYGGSDSTYHGSFFQSIDVYINANWAPAATGSPSFWLDMTPYHADPNNYGAEHNFQLTATGSSVNVGVDGASPSLNLTTSGWYTFEMTYSKGAHPTDPVVSDMNVYDSGGMLVYSTQVLANSPGGPFESQDLRGNGYVYITYWQNGFAGDVLALDNQRTGPLSVPDAGTTVAMLGLGLIGMAGFGLRKRLARV